MIVDNIFLDYSIKEFIMLVNLTFYLTLIIVINLYFMILYRYKFQEKVFVVKVYDYDIRKILYKNFIRRKSYLNTNTVVVNEMDICAGSSRVDIAVVNGSIHGYEIKSKQDTLDRLPGQVEAYNKIFDTMTIVGFENHINKIVDIVPPWWEIKSVYEQKNTIKLASIRRGKKNREIDINSLVLLLWRDEMIDLIINHSEIVKGYKSKTRQQLGKMLVKNINNDFLKVFVRQRLKSRQSWKAVSIQQLSDGYNNR